MERIVWVDYYAECADKLFLFRNDRRKLIDTIYRVYNTIGMTVPKLDSGTVLSDIDPFTVFGLFNKGITNENRIRILTGLKKELDIKADVPHDFNGVPVLNNLSATYYLFGKDRGDKDIENIWNMFSAALSYADDDSEFNRRVFLNAYNTLIKQKRIRWNLSMALFWIRPFAYINLDSTNREFLKDENTLSKAIADTVSNMRSVPDGERYLSFCSDCLDELKSGNHGYKTLPELSHAAYMTGLNKTASADNSGGAAYLRWFRPVIQALKDLNGSGTPAEVRDMIVKNEDLPDETVNEKRKNAQNKLDNEIAWARKYLADDGYIDKSVRGIWKLTEKGWQVEMTDELASEIFKRVNQMYKNGSNGSGNALGDADVETIHYWAYAPGEKAFMWEEFYKAGIMGLGWNGLGDLREFGSKSEITDKCQELYKGDSSYKNTVLALWQFVHEVKPGDVIFVKRGRSELLGKGIVESEYEYDDETYPEYPNIRRVKWTQKGHWQISDTLSMKTLTDITNYTENVNKMLELFESDTESDIEQEKQTINIVPYTKEEFLKEVYLSEQEYEILTDLLRTKKNIILQGAPGVGKTFAAKRLAYSMMRMKDADRVKMIQFHQSYSYEDFIMGFRPGPNGFTIKNGVFYNFCKDAEADTDHEYFFIIDEINRGNLSKIFGELFMLIEDDKRGPKNTVQLLYADQQFYIPENVYIIGMMNTADRSLALLDYALRRRFAFYDLKPAFEKDGFKKYQDDLKNDKFDRLINCVKLLNQEIRNDETLGEGFCIGHSYFCKLQHDTISDTKLHNIVEFELIPLLKEYWYDEPDNIRNWSENLRRAVSD